VSVEALRRAGPPQTSKLNPNYIACPWRSWTVSK